MPIGKYIYGIINSNAHEAVGPYGISACKEAHFIPYQDIAAVVADSEIIDYTHMFKDALARALVEHQKIIERIMGIGYSIIPMRLGTFAMDEAEVEDVLSKGYGLIKEIIPKISDKIEIDVVAVWSDFVSVIRDAGQDKEIKEFKEQLLKQPKGITVDDQMKIGSMLKKALEERREKYAQEIQEALKTVSLDFKTHELMDDKMVANIAFLVNKAKHKDFEVKVEWLNAEFNEKLNFRCVGPLPLHSFYTLEIKTIKDEEIDWAKKRIGILNDITSKNDLKKAYQRQALSTHPDRNPNMPCAGKEFDEVNKAYKILTDYCAALAQANPVRDERSLTGTHRRDNPIVMIRVRE